MATSFRGWMKTVCNSWGDRPEMPWLLMELETKRLPVAPKGSASFGAGLLVELLEAEYVAERGGDHYYGGPEIAICRDKDPWTLAAEGERRSVKALYHACRTNSSRCLQIGLQRYWLLGYEWPNQERARGRRADLVGLSEQGGLVVFECKRGAGGYSPIAAVLEGLDYLACLTSERNFPRIKDKLNLWRNQEGFGLDERFHRVAPSITQVQAVVVLADQAYYQHYISRHERQRGAGLNELLNVKARTGTQLKIGFAETDFGSTEARWLPSLPVR